MLLPHVYTLQVQSCTAYTLCRRDDIVYTLCRSTPANSILIRKSNFPVSILTVLRSTISILFVNFDFPVSILIVIEVVAGAADGEKIKFYCELGNTDYCLHKAFAAASQQVRTALRR